MTTQPVHKNKHGDDDSRFGKKKVLSVAQTDSLRRTRQLLLQEAGYSVSSPDDLSGIEELCKTTTFDVAVIGYAFEPETKRTIAEVIRKYCKTTSIVELTNGYPAIPDAIGAKPDPPDLLATIAAVLNGKQRRAS